LPAVLANAQHQEQIFKELKSGDAPESKLALLAQLAGGSEFESRSRFAFVPSQYGYLEWTEDLIEKKFSEHKAMKEPPKKSALANSPSMANTGEIANEILNDMQRSYGGATELEDESRYLVTVRTPNKKDGTEWKGEVLGPPSLIPQKTVTVVAGGKMFVVLDKSNKKLWQASLTYRIRGGSFYSQAEDEAETSSGEGPCVERGDSLYVFDEATLTAFDLASGNVRWRVPSIGIVGLFFDEKGMLYVNSTTASLDSLKYSRQIDVNATKQAAVLKIDPKSGKVLWSVQPGGFISRVEGKYILCVAKNDAGDGDQDNPYGLPGQMSSLLAIRRLNPKNGKILWDYAQQRCPLDIRFKGNTIELVFKKEVQVLKFLSF
jgi:outer membrane protein assembly factor BamB